MCVVHRCVQMIRAPGSPIAVLGSAKARHVTALVYGKPEGSLHRLHRLGTGVPQLHGAYYVLVYAMLVLTCSSLGETGPGGVWGGIKIACNFPLAVSRFQSAPRLGSHYESFWLFPIQMRREGLSRGE